MVLSTCMSIAMLRPGRAEVLVQRFTAAGLAAVPDRELTRRHRGAQIWHVTDGEEPDLLELAGVARSYARTARSELASRVAVRKRHGAFQPVWTIYPLMRPIDFELLALDDDDACVQLDMLHLLLAGDPLLAGARRSHMTIKPRGDWQNYGHPDIRARG